MQEDFKLIGDFTPTELEQSGLTIVAPGLYGSGQWYGKRVIGETRDFTGERTELDQAIAESGAEDRHTLVIDAPTPKAVGGGARSRGDVADDEALLQVPLGRDEAAVVMYLDEAGVVSFHYEQPRPATTPALPSRAFGAAHQAQYRLRLRAGVSRQPGKSRAMFSRLVSKLIKVLVVKVFPDQVGTYVARRVQAWEEKHRTFQGLHGGTWAQLLDTKPTPVADLSRFVGRRSLLLIHGTSSTTAGAFARLADAPALLDRLSAQYEGRVLAFNHHTLGTAVADNVHQFYEALAGSPGEYAFDVVCHSRGGLVARALTRLAPQSNSAVSGAPSPRLPDVRVSIGRIVFVATPNAGTALADPEGIPQFVERLTNYVNMLPDAALTIASGALLSLAGAVAEVTLPRLPGLADQAPGSPLQEQLAPPPGGTSGFFAFSSDYEPDGDLINVVKDASVDRIFAGEKNDLVVPSAGVAHTPHFDLPEDRIVAFAPKRHVHHSAFFGQKEIVRIADWLELP